MDRVPIVAGQFYPDDPAAMRTEVLNLLDLAENKDNVPSLLVMVPHAGYVYSGAVAGRTLGEARLPSTLVLLGPNHTGHGASLAVWPDGRWLIPGAALEVDSGLASDILSAWPGFKADVAAHTHEHSLEVILPFLHALNPDTKIVPVCVADFNLTNLIAAGMALGEILQARAGEVGIVVSSDMSHYIPHEQARSRDARALAPALAVDPEGLFQAVRRDNITMCGVLPMTLGLAAARRIGTGDTRLVRYATSGEVSGDYRQVVGYAGIIVSRGGQVEA